MYSKKTFSVKTYKSVSFSNTLVARDLGVLVFQYTLVEKDLGAKVWYTYKVIVLMPVEEWYSLLNY